LASISGDFNPEVMFIIDSPKKNRGENRRGSIKKQVPDVTWLPSTASFRASLSAGLNRPQADMHPGGPSVVAQLNFRT
jgi:hypothetical protein